MDKKEPRQAAATKSPETRAQLISELDDRDPFVSWQVVDVQFPEEENTDFVIPHNLRVNHPRDVHYRVIKQFTNGDIYESANADAKKWESDFIVLRSDVPKWTGRILLGVLKKVVRFATNELEIPEEPPPDCCEEAEEPEPPVDCSDVISWSNEPQKVAADSATVDVTPSSTTWANSAWFEIDAAAIDDWVLTGVAIGGGVSNSYFEIDVGYGVAGSEIVAGTVRGFAQTLSYAQGYIPFSIPIDSIPSGARVAVRMRKSNADTTPWRIAATYYNRPLVGAVIATGARQKVTPAGAAGVTFTNPGSWGNGSYVELVPSTPNPWVLSGAVIAPPGAVCEWEVDIATGDSGSEVVVTTFRSRKKDNTSILGGGFYVTSLIPGLEIAAGSRISARMRTSGGGTSNIAITYYEAPNVPALVTSKAQQWLPAGADNETLASAIGGGAGDWVEFHAGGASDLGVTAITYGCDTTASNGHIDIGYGEIGSEVVVASIPLTIHSAVAGSNQIKVLPIAVLIPAGERLIARIDSAVSNHSFGIALGYIEDPDFAQISGNEFSYWDADGVSDVNFGASWADGAWQEIVSDNPQAVLVYGMSYDQLTSNRDFEVDLGVGEVGFEEVVNTFRFSTGAEIYGAAWIPMSLPIKITTGQRVVARGRSSGSAEGGRVQFHYVQMDPPAWDCDGAEGSADPDDPDDPVEDDTPAFQNIAVSGQTTVEATETDTTLTVIGAGTITATTDNTAKSLTLTGAAPTLAGTPDYITISGNTITRGLVDLATDITGDLPFANLTPATAASRLLGRRSASSGDWEEITVGSGLTLSGTTLSANATAAIIGAIGITIDGGGSAITTGIKGYIYVPHACTITAVTMLADVSGSAVVDIWKDSYANFPPLVADTITASAKPTITTATKSQDTTLTGWTTSVSAGDILAFNVDSASTITRLHLVLTTTR
jgi:hypothetical protein